MTVAPTNQFVHFRLSENVYFSSVLKFIYDSYELNKEAIRYNDEARDKVSSKVL